MTEAPQNERILGRYRIVRNLAAGGMGVILLARAEGAAGFAMPVVVKRILDDGLEAKSDAEEFFIREAKILAQLRHPGVVSVLDFARERGGYVMVLEYVHGFHLGQWIRYHRTNREALPRRRRDPRHLPGARRALVRAHRQESGRVAPEDRALRRHAPRTCSSTSKGT